MRKISAILLALLISCMSVGYGQSQPAFKYNWVTPSFYDTIATKIQEALAADPNDTGKKAKMLRRHQYFMSTRVSRDVGYGQDITKPMNAAMKNFMKTTGSSCPSTGKFSGQWSCIGPFQNTWGTNNYESIGRINGIWVSPNDTNHILAGADAGGLWKSTNGGANWQNITDASYSNGSNLVIPGSLGIKYIAVNPLDHNNIVLLVKMESQYQRSWGYTLGMVYSKTTHPFVG